MDLQKPGALEAMRRFPRPRGDGPFLKLANSTAAVVSPPTRGWTLKVRWEIWILVGFPAHAGMDPPALPAGAFTDGFPRPRGDGPLQVLCPSCNLRVSPPTRGWTRDLVPAGHHSDGFPAHAGMDPAMERWLRSLLRFPRPRGDGPTNPSRGNSITLVSPPTRGWTSS